ncbi:MAG: protein phosphatase 2C domain-containing protein [Candidatus Woesearchaeota archaeon]|nr:protein phosphatase 2C domain-containing protein [Candidatus Woesearchaeota archaeon]
MVQVQTFSEGKVKNRNEDYFNYSESCFVIADGATDKSGRNYNGQTGGELVSRIVVNECLSTNLNGIELINHINKKIREAYTKLNILKDIKDPKYRFTCGFICVRVIGGKTIITYLGDLGFRINGIEVYQEIKQIDINDSEERSKYIRETNDVEGSRNHIMHLLVKQFEYQNNPNDSLGYGVIDGSKTPSKFIKTFEYYTEKIKTIELFTDGYFDTSQEVSIKGWEKAFEKVEEEDPDKWKKYKSTKSKDDRTIAIITF